MEVRNESGGLIVLSETDGTEYTFSMDNPDPCVLYSFTVTPLCGTVEGWSAKVNGTPFNGIAVFYHSVLFRIGFLAFYATVSFYSHSYRASHSNGLYLGAYGQ